MGTSCNGCRVLRKGCSESCILRPCLHWITTAESQANATIFLAKFYGRAGLTNLISNGPEHLRPAIFRSLLYDACGRMLDPIYGSLGLLWSGNWADCQAGVDSILRGSFQAGRRGKFMFPDCEMMAPMEGMASRELQRSVEANDRFKRFSDAKAKRRERERAPTSNHIDLNSKSDDWDDRGNKVQKGENGKFNGTYLNTFPTFLSGQQQQDIEIHAAQSEMECWNDLVCTLKSSEAEADACNAVELDLTLGSQRLDFSSSS